MIKIKDQRQANNKDLETMRHSLAHIMAAAVLEMFPEAKLGIGPATTNGFYYDFDLPRTLIPEDLPIIEEKMEKIIKENLPFERVETPIEDAIKEAKKKKEVYKLELLNDLKKEGVREVSFYRTGRFVDLCKGPHVTSTGKVGVFKLTKISGAYWRGDEKNKMLQRIYGVAFETQKELDEYLKNLEEAEKRDHRKLGKELDLFCFSDLVGPGLPLFTPKGVIILEKLKEHIENICRKYGYQKVSAPSLAKIELFETSGHAKKFSDELFHVSSEKRHRFVLKPVQCPHHTQIYASKPRSYRDLPIRYMESDKMYRAEKPGEVGGLNRVYAITVEDGHIFCRSNQIKDEIKNLVNIIKDFYSALGIWGKHWVSLSVRDYNHPEKYIGEPKDWDKCEKILKEVSDEMGLNAKRCEGEAALYGPKLDFMFKDALGKEIQIPTIQLDFATPKRFNLVYINEKGKEENPVMIHRAVLGSYERFLVLLIEHFAGVFPLWLAPIQIQVIPVSDIKHLKYAEQIRDKLIDSGFRVELATQESVGKKIREAELQKIPYMIIVGDREIRARKISVRSFKKGDLGQKSLTVFIKELQKEIEEKR